MIQEDLSHAARSLARDSRITFRAIFALALGIGCSTAIFSIFSAVVLRALPYHDAARLVAIWSQQADLGSMKGGLSADDVLEIRSQVKALESVGSYRPASRIALLVNGEIEDLNAVSVSDDFFQTFDMRPFLGRWLLPEDSSPSSGGVVAFSYSLWTEQFGADRTIIGRMVFLSNKPYTVVGVMPPEFAFPSVGTQIWLPDLPARQDARDKRVIARLKTGEMSAARAELKLAADRIARQFGDANQALTLELGSLRDELVGPVHRIVIYLLASTVLLHLVTCANVANLVLAKNVGRQREFAIRSALGAGRTRIIRHLVFESSILAGLGGVASLFVAICGVYIGRTLGSADIPGLSRTSLDGRTLLFGTAISSLSALTIGIITCLYYFRAEPFSSLREGSSTAEAGFSARRGRRLQSTLLVFQVAMAVVLTESSALMVHSLLRLTSIDIGFEPRNLYAVQLSPKFQDRRQLAYFREMLKEVSQVPMVESAALTTTSPLGRLFYTTVFSIDRGKSGWVTSPDIQFQAVSPKYFQTMGIPLLVGRTFSDYDTLESSCVVVINQIAARTMWPGQVPLEKRINLAEPMSGSRYCLVVGVVQQSRDIRLETPPGPEVYFSDLQRPQVTYALLFRTKQKSTASSVVQRIREFDSFQRVRVTKMEDLINKSLGEPLFRATLAAFFSILSLLLASTGIYAAISYAVSRREHEIGIRIAIGAKPHDIAWLILGNTLLILLVGVLLGLIGAAATSRIIGGLLYEVKPADPLSILMTVLLVASAAFIACYFPAQKAIGADPRALLRYE